MTLGTRHLALPCVLVLSSVLQAQEPGGGTTWQSSPGPEANPTTPSKVELGRELFSNNLLSAGNGVSCASCHDPEKSFGDGLAESVGNLGVQVGRNSPTLLGIGHVAAFPSVEEETVKPPPQQLGEVRFGPGRQRPGPGSRIVVKALTLEERCLAPIENPVEMSTTVEAAVARLNELPELRSRFDKVFGAPRLGATKERLGQALAAFLRSLEPPDAPYKRYLMGEHEALSDEEMAGLRVFEDKGRCADCHSGPALNDGKLHMAMIPTSRRAREALKRSQTIRNEIHLAVRRLRQQGFPIESKALLSPRPRVGGYPPSGRGGAPVEVFTTTLWDVKRTAPYFRDGSVYSLETAVRQHIRELRMVPAAKTRKVVRSVPGPKIPAALLARKHVVPPELSHVEMGSLLRFLATLSPSD